MTTDQILDCLDRQRIRATYGAVGAVIGSPPQSVGDALGRRTQRASWVVNAETGEPTGYDRLQKHPELHRTNRIIKTGDELRRLCAGCRHNPHDTRSEIQPPPDTRPLGSSLIASPKRLVTQLFIWNRRLAAGSREGKPKLPC